MVNIPYQAHNSADRVVFLDTYTEFKTLKWPFKFSAEKIEIILIKLV